MKEYIPNDMVQKQYRWEWVNLYLYRYLKEQNRFHKLKETFSGLLNKQEKQLSSLQKLAVSQGIDIPPANIRVEFKSVLKCIKELHDREYQLLQEYISYEKYFLPLSSPQLGIQELVSSQLAQVNTLVGLKNTFSEWSKKEEPQDKPQYKLEKGYRLERVTTGLTFPTVMAFDAEGTIYIAESGFAYGTEPGERPRSSAGERWFVHRI